MKRVTIYTIGQEQREIAGDWVRIRTELQRLHPIQPWNVDPDKDDTAVALADEHAEIIKVRLLEGGVVEDRYVAISRDLAELLIPALQPVAQKRLETEIQERKRVEVALNLARSQVGDARTDARRLREALDRERTRISDFLWLPWHKRLWRAWKGRL